MPLNIFKKKGKTPGLPEPDKDTGMIYSKTSRQDHGPDVVDENGILQVAGCLPIDPINKRFLLISSSSNPNAWVIPKGGWEKDETQKETAMREAWEEAGVKGMITRHIGVFAEKSKSDIKAHHWIYEMEIKEVTKNFPEQDKRKRRWFTYEEAILGVKANFIHDALSMSSLNPMLYGEEGKKKKKKKKNKEATESPTETEDDDEEEKKKKKKEKKKKEKELIEETISFEDDDDEKEKKEKKKKKKKSNKQDEEEDDENMQEAEIEGKNKKKGKEDNDIIDLSEETPSTSNPSVNQLNQQLKKTHMYSEKEQVYPDTLQ